MLYLNDIIKKIGHFFVFHFIKNILKGMQGGFDYDR